jgi:hypothetical protein
VAIITAEPGRYAMLAKRGIDLAFIARGKHTQLPPELLRRRLCAFRFALCNRIARVD